MNEREDELWAMIEARDETIRVLQKKLEQPVDELQAKQDVIQRQNRILAEMREVCAVCVALSGILRPAVRMAKPMYLFFKPRLGRLQQFPPRPLWTPAAYDRGLKAKDNWPTISVVTPSYNQARFIERTLQSVLSQSYPRLEFLVQDGGSADGTRSILESYEEQLGGWTSEPDKGQADAINRGFAKSTGEVMAWLNSDDLFLPGALQYVGDYFARHPDVDVVYGHRVLINEDGQEIGRWIMPSHNNDILSWADFVPQETLFWRRSIWEEAGGGLDENHQFALDWDLLLRFREAGARFARLPRLLGAFRVHESQKTSSVMDDVGRREMDALRKRELGRVPSKTEIEKAMFSYLLKHVAADFRWAVYERFARR